MAFLRTFNPEPETRTMNARQTTDEMLQIAKTVAGERATVSLYAGSKQTAIRITGCFAEEARPVGMDIARALFGQPDCETGLWKNPRVGYEYSPPYALVWLP